MQLPKFKKGLYLAVGVVGILLILYLLATTLNWILVLLFPMFISYIKIGLGKYIPNRPISISFYLSIPLVLSSLLVLSESLLGNPNGYGFIAPLIVLVFGSIAVLSGILYIVSIGIILAILFYYPGIYLLWKNNKVIDTAPTA